MRAMVIEEFGGPEKLKPADVDRPEAGHGEILVKVMASGTNPVEAKVRAGIAYPVELPAILGADASGVVEEVGEGVTKFTVGDEVFYTPRLDNPHGGTYAEYAVVGADIAARKPRNIGHIEAASVPLAGATAYESLVRRLRLQPGETILIHGGAGGVGSFAVQIAKSTGAKVIATSSTTNLDTIKQLGADIVVDYTRENPYEIALEATDGAGVDTVFTPVGADTVRESSGATRTYGRIATILAFDGDLTSVYRNNQTIYGVMLTRDGVLLERLRELIELGHIHPLVDQVLPLEEVGVAHRRLDSGHGRGKIVLDIAG